MSEAERKERGIESPARSLWEAIEHAEGSTLLRRCLGDHLFESLITNKKIEWSNFRSMSRLRDQSATFRHCRRFRAPLSSDPDDRQPRMTQSRPERTLSHDRHHADHRHRGRRPRRPERIRELGFKDHLSRGRANHRRRPRPRLSELGAEFTAMSGVDSSSASASPTSSPAAR